MEEILKIDLHVDSHLIFEKNSKTTEWIKDSLQK